MQVVVGHFEDREPCKLLKEVNNLVGMKHLVVGMNQEVALTGGDRGSVEPK